MDKKSQYIILFDGICNLCNWSVEFVIKRDSKRKFKFFSLQSEAGKSLLNNFDRNSSGLDTIIYLKDDKRYIKSTAILHILKDIGGIWKLFYLGIIVPKFIRDFFYNLIAKYRYNIFGKRESCTIPIKKRGY
jgi:predicted DCC family thiol-disulfide oxidoreductase YuxK